MKSKLLIMSTAALLAGTLAAASQSNLPNGATPEKSQQGSSQGVNSKEEITKKGSQAQQDKLKGQTQGQAQRDQDQLKGQSKGEPDKVKGKTQGQAQREPDKASSQPQGQEKDKAKTQTQGQASPAPREQGQMQRSQQGETQQGQTPRDKDRIQQGAREGEHGSNVSVSFTTEQRTKIRETVLKERNAPRVGKVDFAIREGTVVPRTVRVVEIPQVIVEIHPEWRGFKYFLVNDELVIVEPDTLRIVAVVDV
jgi:Protein of unknown function (DUF1236)